jgi:hypothetical protein
VVEGEPGLRVSDNLDRSGAAENPAGANEPAADIGVLVDVLGVRLDTVEAWRVTRRNWSLSWLFRVTE